MPALDYLDRRRRLLKLRAQIDDPDLQFFLALLLNVDGRQAILDLVKQRDPDADPIEMFVRCGAELATRVHAGVDAESAQWAIRALLAGQTPDTRSVDTSPPWTVSETLRGSWLFKPWVSEESWHRALAR